ncbi:hypothetical protein [Haloarcula halophila]|uniref:hypothetical protein n=1 Tax=Haloarcula TaxID=2237 RepID=UPI0023E393C6|nr:hypothetical protein [Halomicroarcula sp. DFY41]
MNSNAYKEVATRGRYTQEDLDLNKAQWGNFKTYVDAVELAVNSSNNSPRIVGSEEFRPGAWVGNYNNLVSVTPEKVTTEQYEKMVNEVASFVHLFKKPIADAILPEQPDLIVEGKVAYPRYSQTLLFYTEELLAGRLPVQIRRKSSRGFEFEGPPDLQGVIKERARGSHMLVSRETKFTFDTPANHLLYEFHSQMAAHLDHLIENYAHLPEKIPKQLQHHINFLNTAVPEDVVNSDASPALRDPTVLAKIRGQSSGVIMEIVDLWEAYLHQRAQLDPFENFATAIKPIYEVFEIWCLHRVLEILENEYGSWTPNRDRSAASQFVFEEADAVLYYDTSVSSHSRYVANEDAFGKRESGRPDFVFVLNGEIRWLADAKFQNLDRLGISGIQRFLGYLMDFIDTSLEQTPPTALLGIGDSSSIKTFSVEGIQVHQLSLMSAGTLESTGLEAVRDMIVEES